MKPRRVVLVSRQFWPLVGGAQVVMGNLARALQTLGLEVTVLTAQWEASWPSELIHRGVHVIRLPQPGVRLWGLWRYMQALQAWLLEHRGEYDLVYVSKLKQDAYAALAARLSVPVVLRPERAGPRGDIHWQQHAPFGRMIARRCRQAAAIVAKAEPLRQELLAAGYAAERIAVIAGGVEIPPPREPADQAAARAELAQAARDLALPEDAPLAVYTGRLEARKGLTALVAAWPQVLDRFRQARLWLIGDGPLRDELAAQIRALGLRERVLLAGQFDAVDDFYRAANLFVLPSEEELMSMALLEAMAAGLPAVVSDIPANRNLVTHEKEGLLVPTNHSPALAAAITRLLASPEEAATLGAAARTRVTQNFSLATMANAHLELFERVCALKRS